MTLTDADTFARWGNATAALCIKKRGAIPAMPSADEVTAFMERA
jgi:fructokinase